MMLGSAYKISFGYNLGQIHIFFQIIALLWYTTKGIESIMNLVNISTLR